MNANMTSSSRKKVSGSRPGNSWPHPEVLILMNDRISLYIASRKIAQRVQMADFEVRVKNCPKPGHLCAPHVDAVKVHGEILSVRVMSAAGRNKFSCDLCWAGLPLKVA